MTDTPIMQNESVRLAGMMLKSQGYPVDDKALMAELVPIHIRHICEVEGVMPRGQFIVRDLEPAMIDGIPLTDDAGIRWEVDAVPMGDAGAERPTR